MSRQPRPQVKLPIVRQHDENSKFYIDFDWWKQSGLELKSYLSSRLNIQADISLNSEIEVIDVVDAKTGEVRRVDGFQYVLQKYFKQMPEDFVRRAALVDAVFCVLLGNANQPMAAKEISERVHRPVDTVLKTLSGSTIYQGIRPLYEDN